MEGQDEESKGSSAAVQLGRFRSSLTLNAYLYVIAEYTHRLLSSIPARACPAWRGCPAAAAPGRGRGWRRGASAGAGRRGRRDRRCPGASAGGGWDGGWVLVQEWEPRVGELRTLGSGPSTAGRVPPKGAAGSTAAYTAAARRVRRRTWIWRARKRRGSGRSGCLLRYTA